MQGNTDQQYQGSKLPLFEKCILKTFFFFFFWLYTLYWNTAYVKFILSSRLVVFKKCLFRLILIKDSLRTDTLLYIWLIFFFQRNLSGQILSFHVANCCNHHKNKRGFKAQLWYLSLTWAQALPLSSLGTVPSFWLWLAAPQAAGRCKEVSSASGLCFSLSHKTA